MARDTKYGADPERPPISAIAERLMAVRRAHRMTQQEFADRLGFVKRTYLAWERSESEPPIRLAAAVMREFGIDANWLVDGPGLEPVPKGAWSDWERLVSIHEDLTAKLQELQIDVSPGQAITNLQVVASELREHETLTKGVVVRVLGVSAKYRDLNRLNGTKAVG